MLVHEGCHKVVGSPCGTESMPVNMVTFCKWLWRCQFLKTKETGHIHLVLNESSWLITKGTQNLMTKQGGEGEDHISSHFLGALIFIGVTVTWGNDINVCV